MLYNKINDMCKIRAWMILLALTSLAYTLSFVPLFLTLKLSPLIIAVVLGMFVGNLSKKLVVLLAETEVIAISTKQILRLGIILYGFRITLADIAFVGLGGVLYAFLIVFSTFLIGCFLGKRIGLDEKSTILISAGSSICGAAAVLASESVVKGGSERVAVAVCTVVVFGTASMFLYPALYHMGVFTLDLEKMGFLMGGVLHEVAHAVAAGEALGGKAAVTTVIIKMLRVVMLVPFLMLLALFFVSKGSKSGIKQSIPYFAFWFLAAVIAGSFFGTEFQRAFVPIINVIDTFLLSLAMFALGLTIRKNVLASAGKKPFILAALLMLWLFLSAYALVYFLLGSLV